MKEYIKKILLRLCRLADRQIGQIERKCGYGKKQYILNLNKENGKKQKRVLISYMDYVYVGKELADGAQHPNRYEFCQIIRYFLKHNYVLDICAANDLDIIEYAQKQDYDVIFGLGQVFREVASVSSAFKIIYMTENPYYVSYEREKERIEYFYQRHKRKVGFARTGLFYEENDEKLADAVICTGDKRFFSGLSAEVYRIWPTAMINAGRGHFGKRSTKNFLVLGTDGFVHKGIDLLVEVFWHHSDWNLYLCGYDIQRKLKKLGYVSVPSNIHDCGYINVMGEQFTELAGKCMYILLPSCSEAPSTAVLTGMGNGLLPIIMKGNGMDEFGEYCTFFEDFTLEGVERVIEKAVLCEPGECTKRAEKVMDYAGKSFTIERFTDSIEAIFDTLLEKRMI